MTELAYGVAASILEKLGSVAHEELSLAFGMKKDLKKLGDKTLMLRSVLNDAEKKQANNEQLQMWLVRVKDVFNDALDVLDEFECEVLRRQVLKEYGSFGKKVNRYFSRSNPIAFRFSIAHKVKEIRQRLDEIAGDMAHFQLIRIQLNMVEEPSPLSDRMTHSYVKASEVIGRDSDKARIISMLLSQDDHGSSDDLPVIAIVGIGGLGKTTLAKSVYHDPKIQGKFDLKLWVCVSPDFDVVRLLREILREAKMEEDVSKMSIERLQTSLRSILEGKKFMLVLDDVWNEDRNKWLELRQFLAVGAEGSKVIVTTRSSSVSSIMSKAPPHELKGLSDVYSLSLFNTYAFGGEIEAKRHPNLRDISTAIAKNCHGLPLALKTLGSLLYKKPEAEWVRFRDHKIWELERDGGHILPVLRLSYNTMSPCLKRCFAYCSTLPDDTMLGSFQLIPIWMALGIIHSPSGDMELEDIGELQLMELHARSFLQYQDDETRDMVAIFGFLFTDRYKMHDLIHELACSITNTECCIVKSNMDFISNRVRQLKINLNENNLPWVWSSKKLQSLHIDPASEYDITTSFLTTCITRLKYLRVFDMQSSSLKVLPSSIDNLKHLRYLNLSNNQNVKRLPESICEVQSLQTLLLDHCNKFEELPRGIRKLVSLRILTVTTRQTHFLENGIGCLKSLRTLIIIECENLRSLPDDIKFCTTLRNLHLITCGKFNFGCESGEAIIEIRLQSLFLIELPKITGFPHWLQGASKTLKFIALGNCQNLVELPYWLAIFISLKTLYILGCRKLVALPDGMNNLVSLSTVMIEDCENLNLECKLENIRPLVLQKMTISSLPKTRALPQWLNGASNTLKCLEIRDCPRLAELPNWLPNFSSLEKLTIKDCEELLVLPKDMSRLTSLTSLVIGECEQLELASESNEVLQLSHQSCVISLLPRTTALPQWLQGADRSLKTLHIEYCPMLASLPEWLSAFTSLEKLVITCCIGLSSLPKGMSSLTHLEVTNPSDAFYERYRPETGTEWGAICHISNIHISEPWETRSRYKRIAMEVEFDIE